MNRSKFDRNYARRKLELVLRDLNDYTAAEFWREISRIASGATGLPSAEQLQAHAKELEAINLGLTKALRHVCELHCVDDYYSGKLRNKEIDRAVNSALESVMPTCKRDKKPCGKAGGYCLECPSGPRREWLSN